MQNAIGLLKRYPASSDVKWTAEIETEDHQNITTVRLRGDQILYFYYKHEGVRVFEHIHRHLKAGINDAKERLHQKVKHKFKLSIIVILLFAS